MIYKLIILAIIVYIKAIFSASETAFTYLNKAKFNQMSKTNNKKIKVVRIKQFLDNKLKIYGATKVGITLTELLASVFAAETFVKILMESIIRVGLSITLGYILAIVIVTIVLSYITLVFGELIPRRVARNNPEKVAYRTVNTLFAFSKMNYMFEKILTKSEDLFSKIFGIKNEPNEKLTEKEIKLIIAEGKDQGIFDEDEKKLLYNALKFDNLKIKDIMIERDKMICINTENTKEKNLEIIQKYKYTRIPIYSKTKDNIIGVLNIKDVLLKSLEKDGKIDIKLQEFIREPIYVNKKDKIDDIFREMQLNNKHIAIVKDKDDRTEGMLTMEDIVEKLLGNIIDEFNK